VTEIWSSTLDFKSSHCFGYYFCETTFGLYVCFFDKYFQFFNHLRFRLDIEKFGGKKKI